ncbi:class I SAM-dependent methyltransferase [uncultured Desulfobacter sp.]|uniref:class I SAM-dependent methyltransferase n=1 Tax=uncultured Desulfobacter sp. TaxID=240139 RepID=UPI0029F4778E|nr:class I SAM-dependent methyltransferase [uncultured Desulfobacter sp.]
MDPRKCPVCSSSDSTLLMQFTPEQLCLNNPSYDLDILREAIKGQEQYLSYSKCNRCSMVFCEKYWDDENLNIVYSDIIMHEKSKEKIFSIDKRRMLLNTWTNILRLLKFQGKIKLDSIKLVDFGCGWGDFLEVVNGSGVEAMGFDQDQQKVNYAKARRHRIAHTPEKLIEFGPVDIFVMNSVIEHIQDVGEIFNLVNSVLTPGGIFVCSVMDYRERFLRKSAKRLKRGLPALTKNLNPVEHVNIYNYDSVLATLEKYGFHFLATRHVLYVTDTYGLKNNMKVIHWFNLIEKWLLKLFSGREFGIQVYALKH